MRFRLRALLILIAVIAVALGQWRRVTYLQSQASFHERQAQLLADFTWGTARLGPERRQGNRSAMRWGPEYQIHRELAEQCRRAVWRPWATVAEPPAGTLTKLE